MKKTVDEYRFQMTDGTPTKRITVPIARSKCKYCGRKIRWVRSEFGQLTPAEAELHIIDLDVAPQYADKFITRAGKDVRGVIVDRAAKGCRLGFKVHDCRERSVE